MKKGKPSEEAYRKNVLKLNFCYFNKKKKVVKKIQTKTMLYFKQTNSLKIQNQTVLKILNIKKNLKNDKYRTRINLYKYMNIKLNLYKI